jgi:UDP-glucose 4-epimerase
MFDDVNHRLAVHFARMAKRKKVKHFVQMSSISVYGNIQMIDFNTMPEPVDEYGKSKYSADLEIMELHDEQFIVSICRPPLIYGGENTPGNMMRLIKLVDKYRILPFKNINNKRDFLHVRNLIIFFELIIEKQISGILLPTDRNAVSTTQLITLIAGSLSKNIKLVKIPAYIRRFLFLFFPGLITKLYGSLEINYSCKVEGNEVFVPEFTLKDGIQEMVQWYLDN